MARWLYHSTSPAGRIFQDDEQDPDGWVDSPAKINPPKKRGRPAKDAKEDMGIQKGTQEASSSQGDTSQEP